MDMIQSNEQINSGIQHEPDFPYAYHRVSSYDPNMCSTARFTPPYPSHENDVESNYENVILIPCSNTDSEKIRNVHENSLSASAEVQGSYSIDNESPDTDYVRSATDQGASIFNGQRVHQASFRTISVEQIDDGNGRYIHQISSAAETSIESPSGHIILHRSPNGHIYQNYYVNQDEHATEMVELVQVAEGEQVYESDYIQIKNSHGLPPVEYNYQPKMPNNGELMEHLSDTAFVHLESAMIPEQGPELLPESYGQIASNHSDANLHGKDQQRILLESTMSPLLAAVNDITQRDAELQSYLNQTPIKESTDLGRFTTDTPIEKTPQQIYNRRMNSDHFDYSKKLNKLNFNDLKQDDDVGDYRKRIFKKRKSHFDFIVSDKPVESRARASLPTNYLYFCKSKIEGEVPSVYAKKEIPFRTKFGPFEGEPRFITEEMVDVLRIQTVRTYPILLLEETRILDITNENTSNWMRFIRMANTFTEQNLLLLEEAGKLYFKSCRIIKPKEELRVGYSDQYAEHYGVRTLTPTERESEEIFHRDNPWLCYECNQRFPTSNEMQSHLSVHEIEEDAQLESKKKSKTPKKKKPIKRMMEMRKNSSRCCYCFKVFMTSVSLKKHMAQHLAEKRSFKGSAKNLSSEIAHHFKCNVCHKKFPSDEKLKTHRLLHVKNELNLYSCGHCDQGFSTQSALDMHEKYHTNRRFKCVFCPETFKHVPDFKNHVSIHAVNGIYACHLCKKKYREYYLVRKHIRVFHPAVKHSCNECGRQFINVNFLRRHKVCHSEKREFLCSECGKQFKRKDKLREHILRMHTGNRKTSKKKRIFEDKQTNDISRYLEFNPLIDNLPKQPKDPPNDFKEFAYKCNECMIGFKRRGMLVNHIAKRHPGVNIDSVPELNQPIIRYKSIFLCQYCNKVYKSNGKRKIHILKNHPGEELPPSARSQPEPSKVNVQKIGNVKTEPQRCQWCYKQYATRNRLLCHYRKEHPGKPPIIENGKQEFIPHGFYRPPDSPENKLLKLSSAALELSSLEDRKFFDFLNERSVDHSSINPTAPLDDNTNAFSKVDVNFKVVEGEFAETSSSAELNRLPQLFEEVLIK